MKNLVLSDDNKSQIALQLHITGKCNLRCKHCYQEFYNDEILSYEQIKKIIKQFIKLKCKYNKKKNINKKGSVCITGGEPFVRKDIFDILKFLNQYKDDIDFFILTNGTLITDEIAKKLKEFNLLYVQVSIDGNEEVHNSIRGCENFRKALDGIDVLKKYNIPVCVSFTANRVNYKTFSEVVDCCVEHNVNLVWSDRMVPMGNGKEIMDNCLSAEENMDYFSILLKNRNRLQKNNSSTWISMDRSLQFILSKEKPHMCVAADSIITINEKGEILPCRRMPIVCGNILNDNICDVYFNNDTFKDLRKRVIAKGCEKCRFRYLCNGGAKCISYAIYNNYNIAEPFCPLIYYNKHIN